MWHHLPAKRRLRWLTPSMENAASIHKTSTAWVLTWQCCQNKMPWEDTSRGSEKCRLYKLKMPLLSVNPVFGHCLLLKNFSIKNRRNIQRCPLRSVTYTRVTKEEVCSESAYPIQKLILAMAYHSTFWWCYSVSLIFTFAQTFFGMVIASFWCSFGVQHV